MKVISIETWSLLMNKDSFYSRKRKIEWKRSRLGYQNILRCLALRTNAYFRSKKKMICRCFKTVKSTRNAIWVHTGRLEIGIKMKSRLRKNYNFESKFCGEECGCLVTEIESCMLILKDHWKVLGRFHIDKFSIYHLKPFSLFL